MRSLVGKRMFCMPQTTVTTTFAAAFVGMNPDVTDVGDNYITRLSGETTLNIPFGVAVCAGTNADQAINLTGQSVHLLGIVPYGAYQINHELNNVVDANGNLGLIPNTAVRIKRRGRLWVQIEENVNFGDAVKIRTANLSAGIGPGSFRKTAVSSNTLDISKFAHWIGANLSANGYGLLEFDFTMEANKSSD